ncbi:MAG: hypothetical protein K0R59_3427 [Sphingobacterium sp.]|jgi:hypothetical protein|nr:hypothetical protein [Sphingobacterium sp.]
MTLNLNVLLREICSYYCGKFICTKCSNIIAVDLFTLNSIVLFAVNPFALLR